MQRTLTRTHRATPVSRRGRQVVAMTRGEPPASKYCFSARCSILQGEASPGTMGLVFGYDKRPSISKDVENVCQIFCREAGYEPGDVELYMHTECPVEVHNEIFVTIFENPTLEDVTVETMHDIAIQQRFKIPKPGQSDTNDSDTEDPGPPPGRGGGGGGGSGGGGGWGSGGGRGNGGVPRDPQPSGGGLPGIEMALPV